MSPTCGRVVICLVAQLSRALLYNRVFGLFRLFKVYAAVLELCLRTVKTSVAAGPKQDLLSQWYTSLPPQALSGPGSRKLHLCALRYLVQVCVCVCVCFGPLCGVVEHLCMKYVLRKINRVVHGSSWES